MEPMKEAVWAVCGRRHGAGERRDDYGKHGRERDRGGRNSFEIVKKADQIGAQKIRVDTMPFSSSLTWPAPMAVPYGISRLLAGVAFCLGLILVVIGRAKLFTGNP